MNSLPPGTGRASVSRDEERRIEAILNELELSDEESDALRPLMRLMVGTAVIGLDELSMRMQFWQSETRSTRPVTGTDEGDEGDSTASRLFVSSATAPDSPGAELRYALIGLLFETQTRFARRGSSVLGAASRTADAITGPLFRWMDNARALQPARDRFDTLVSRGESVTRRWIERGRIEETRSRRLVHTAIDDTFDFSMDVLAEAPQIQELVMKQGMGMTEEVLEEVRERTVSGDRLVESIVRSLLRRPPRESLPEPEVVRYIIQPVTERQQ